MAVQSTDNIVQQYFRQQETCGTAHGLRVKTTGFLFCLGTAYTLSRFHTSFQTRFCSDRCYSRFHFASVYAHRKLDSLSKRPHTQHSAADLTIGAGQQQLVLLVATSTTSVKQFEVC